MALFLTEKCYQSTPNGIPMGHVLGGLPSDGFQFRNIARQFYVKGNGENDPRNFIISDILGISCGIFKTRLTQLHFLSEIQNRLTDTGQKRKE